MARQTEKPPVTIRFPEQVLAAIDEIRQEELRSRTNMITKMVIEWLREHGYPDMTLDDPD